MDKVRLFEAFAGYGSQLVALRRLEKEWGEEFVVPVGYSEIDKYAIEAHKKLHGDCCPNYGDISKVDWDEVPDFDLFTYSFPCQDVSAAGLQQGFKQGGGTRSSLLWECCRAITAKRPKWLLMENVKALVSNKFMPDFQLWIDWLKKEGYSSDWKVIDAKDYGVPQHRERVFMVSYYGKNNPFRFPKPWELDKCLEDVLEDNVDEKYYLPQSALDKFRFDEKFARDVVKDIQDDEIKSE